MLADDCLQTLKHDNSILALTTSSDGRLYVAAGDAIEVWDLKLLITLTTLVAHNGAVLALLAPPSNDRLFSSATNAITVWDVVSFEALYVIHAPQSNIGEIFSLAYSPTLNVLFLGSQDASIAHVRLPYTKTSSFRKIGIKSAASPSGQSTPAGITIPSAYHKFFDSRSRKELVEQLTELSRTQSHESSGSHPMAGRPTDQSISAPELLQIAHDRIITYAHHGYVYSLQVIEREDSLQLLSAAGDGTIKIWRLAIQADKLECKLDHTFHSEDDAAVFSVIYNENTILAGLQGGKIKIIDFDTKQCIRTISAHDADVLALTFTRDSFVSCSADGQMKRWTRHFQPHSTWQAHSGICLALSVYENDRGGNLIFSGGSDRCVKIWPVGTQHERLASERGLQSELIQLLGEFVQFKTISSDETYREPCRQGALFLKRALRDMGAHATLIPTIQGRNPIVLATFKASSNKAKQRVLYYGHYDVVSAGQLDSWSSDPFVLSGRNGYLYGRGVTDNKGCTLAVACAVSMLLQEDKLENDVVMLVEGEEESGSQGLREAVMSNLKEIGHIDIILLANSYWIGNSLPCLNYSLRGVSRSQSLLYPTEFRDMSATVHVNVSISAARKDLHSGQHGGLVSEPLFDLSRVLAMLHDEAGRCLIPGFYDSVAPVSQAEETAFLELLRRLTDDTNKRMRSLESLKHGWREPTCNLHRFDTSGSATSSQAILPSRAVASLSIRIVPNQSIEEIGSSLRKYLVQAYDSIGGKDQLNIEIKHTADWWLGDKTSPYIQAMFERIRKEWDIEPLWICEGGSIPSIPWLEKTLKAPACQFPMGQASDAAHLSNERIRMLNLERGQDIVYHWLQDIASIQPNNLIGSTI